MAKIRKNLPIPLKFGKHVICDIRDGTQWLCDEHNAEDALRNKMQELQHFLTSEESQFAMGQMISRSISNTLGKNVRVARLGGTESTETDTSRWYSDYVDDDTSELDDFWPVDWIGPFYVMSGCLHIKNVMPACDEFYALVEKLEAEGHPLATLQLLERASGYKMALRTLLSKELHKKEIDDE